MASQDCDGCGASVHVAGGIAELWASDHAATGGIALELIDGTEQFLCHDCIDDLPDDEGPVTAADVDALPRSDEQ